jgi:hypothetical protein
MNKNVPNPNSMLKNIPPPSGTPRLIYNGGGRDEISTTAATFSGIKITPIEVVTITEDMVAVIQFVVECRVTPGHELKARMMRTNEGSYPCLESTVVLTTSPKYETRSHMCAFGLPPGDHELYMEICVSGGTGYIRYRYFTVILSTI